MPEKIQRHPIIYYTDIIMIEKVFLLLIIL